MLTFAFSGLPSYWSEAWEVEWTIDGKEAHIENPLGCEYIHLDFEKLTGQIEYRFTQEDLSEDFVLAASPNDRYRLQVANLCGAGDGYWGQVVLVDSETGSIDYARKLPVRYGGDEASTNFASNSCFTAADGQILNIHTVETPEEYRTVTLSLSGDVSDVIYCNCIYDIQNNRYFLAYLDGVGVKGDGWHDYENAVYHVAVFSGELQMIQDVAVPDLEITHSLYALPCPGMVWDGRVLTLGGVPVYLSLS